MPHPSGTPSNNTDRTWLNITGLSATTPGKRGCYGMTYDGFDGYVVLYGGCSGSGPRGDTWKYANGVWTNLSISGPWQRYWPSMTYDANDHYVVLFGGQVNNSESNDTWKFSSGAWTQLKTSPTPKGRLAASMGYDATDKYVVLFGGYAASLLQDYADTWTFAAGAWSQVTYGTGAVHPSAREGAELTWDGANKSVLLFGGYSFIKGNVLADTYTFLAGNWTKITPIASPGARELQAMVYDPNIGAVVLYGGDGIKGPTNDAWTYALTNWTPLNVTPTPPKRTDAGLAWDSNGGYAILYGGGSGSVSTVYSDVWTLGVTILGTLALLPPAIDVGQSTTIRAAGFANNSPYITYSYSGLPSPCTSSNVSSFSCTPSNVGVYTILVNVTDSAGDSVFANASLNVTTPPKITWILASPSALTLGQSIRINISTSGGVYPLAYSYAGLPSGCSTRNADNLSCVPRTASTFNVTATIVDFLGGRNSTNVSFVVNPVPRILSFSTSLPAIDLGQTVHFLVTTSGGTGALTYNYSSLPSGCSSANTSDLACTPNAIGSYTVRVFATDMAGFSVNTTTALTVNSAVTIVSINASPTALDLGQQFTVSVNASGGTGLFTFSYKGGPAGCQATNGTPLLCSANSVGTFTITATATDIVGGNASRSVVVVVAANPSVSGLTASPSRIDLGQSVTITANATGGTGGLTYLYSGLPAGCVGSNSATITCTPTLVGAFTVRLKVSDTVGKNSATASAPLLVNRNLKVLGFEVTPALIDQGSTSNFSVRVSGGTSPFSYNYSNLPAGCQSANVSLLSCTPSTAGNFSVTVTVTDQAGSSAQAFANLTVNATARQSVAPSSTPVMTYLLYGAIAAAVAVAAVALLLWSRRRPPASASPRASSAAPEETSAEQPAADAGGDIWPEGPPPPRVTDPDVET